VSWRVARRWLGALVLGASACTAGPAGTPIEKAARECVAAPAPRYAVMRASELPATLAVALERRRELLFVPGHVDGCEAGDFILDTGAAVTALDPTVAERLRVRKVVELMVGGLYGAAPGAFLEPTSLVVGDVGLDPRHTVAVSLADFAPALGGDVAGIIGFSALGPAPFSLDFVANRLTFHNPASFTAPAGARGELLRVNGGVPYVEATLADGVTVWLLLDTGSLMPLSLWRDVVEAHPSALSVPHKRWSQVAGVGGGTQVMVSEVESIRIFGEVLDGVTVSVQDRPPHVWQHPQAAGLVGMQVLQDLRLTVFPDHRRIWTERLR
jgi:hypothetical protein